MSAFQIIAGGIITAAGLGFIAYVAVLVMLPNVTRRRRDPLDEHIASAPGRPDQSIEDKVRRWG